MLVSLSGLLVAVRFGGSRARRRSLVVVVVGEVEIERAFTRYEGLDVFIGRFEVEGSRLSLGSSASAVERGRLRERMSNELVGDSGLASGLGGDDLRDRLG